MGSGGEGVFFGRNQETLLGDFAAYIGSRTLCQMEEVGEKDFKPPCQRKILSLVRLVSEAEPNLELNQTADCCSNETQNWVRQMMNICHVI